MAGDLVLRARTSWKAFASVYLLAAALAVAIWYVGFRYDLGVPAWIVVMIGFVPPVVVAAGSWLVRASREYRIFQDSLEVDTGIVARRIDNIQMFRVRDIGLSQSVLGRILGVGDVIVTSTDHSSPLIVLRGANDPRAVYETLRGLVAKTATRRTIVVERENPPA